MKEILSSLWKKCASGLLAVSLVACASKPVQQNQTIEIPTYDSKGGKIPLSIAYGQDPATNEQVITSISGPTFNPSDCQQYDPNIGPTGSLGFERAFVCGALTKTADSWQVDREELIKDFYPKIFVIDPTDMSLVCPTAGLKIEGCYNQPTDTIFIDDIHIAQPLITAHEITHDLFGSGRLFNGKDIALGNICLDKSESGLNIWIPLKDYPADLLYPSYQSELEKNPNLIALVRIHNELFITIGETIMLIKTSPAITNDEIIARSYYLTAFGQDQQNINLLIEFIRRAANNPDYPLLGPFFSHSDHTLEDWLTTLSANYYGPKNTTIESGIDALIRLNFAFTSINPQTMIPQNLPAYQECVK